MLLITGATGHTGQLLLEELSYSENKYKIRCIVKKTSKNIDEIIKYDTEIVYGDMEDDLEVLKPFFKDIDTVIHIVNIKYSPKILKLCALTGVKKIIFIHTTGMYSKFREYADDYISIEREIKENCKIDYVILKPTMIYGSIKDHNMHKLIGYIRNHKFFPIFGNGSGLMQPVYAQDLAKAIVLALESDNAVNKEYIISGGSVLKYKEILKLIAQKVNPGIHFIFLPFRLSIILGVIYNLLSGILGRKAQISIEQIKRLSENKSYSFEEANKELGYFPIMFEEGIEREIKSIFF